MSRNRLIGLSVFLLAVLIMSVNHDRIIWNNQTLLFDGAEVVLTSVAFFFLAHDLWTSLANKG